jgi:TRAP-type mannitol/chloroaromatic compound transport system permease small subunit
MKIVRILDKIVDVLSKAALLCGGILLLVMAFNITYGVLARYVFNAPSVYAMELTKILMIPALVLAVAYVQRNNRHLQVDFLSSRFSQKARLILLEIIVPIAGLFVGFVLVWKGWESMTYSYSIHETSYSSWAEPLWPVRLMIPIGYGLLCIVMVAQLCKGIARLLDMKGDTTEGSEATAKSERV